MYKQEFESLAGYRVTDSDYFGIIEPMYMATNLSKVDFVACLDRKRFALPTEAEAIRTLKKMAKEYANTERASEESFDAWASLEKACEEFAKEHHSIDNVNESEWCYVNDKRSRTSGRVLSVVLEFGRRNHQQTIELYKRPNVSAYEALTF